MGMIPLLSHNPLLLCRVYSAVVSNGIGKGTMQSIDMHRSPFGNPIQQLLQLLIFYIAHGQALSCNHEG